MLNWFWRSCSYPESIAKSPVPCCCTNTNLHLKAIEPLFCPEESCVPFIAEILAIFPTFILPFSCLLTSNVFQKPSQPQNTLTVSLKCHISSRLRVVQYPEFFIVQFIFDLYILVLCPIYLLHIAWLLPHSFGEGNPVLLCFSTVTRLQCQTLSWHIL